MNANIYEYGTDLNTGLNRRLVRDTAVVQEETDNNSSPKAVVHLRLQTYVEINGVIKVVTDVSETYEVVKGLISNDVNGNILPKNEIDPLTGDSTTPINPDTGQPYHRDNGYDNIILLSKLPIPFDSVLDEGIKEYYNL
tara:strand:- start:70 stop:486 length:417 start_codon:yes stop_codon:yes gene_type:complete